MKKIPLLVWGALVASVGALEAAAPQAAPALVAAFQGQQVTGVTVAPTGRVFVNFPKWREAVACDVAEVLDVRTAKPYPDARWNSWRIGELVVPDKFLCVQSVVSHGDRLYVLDTANPMFNGVLTSPRLFVFDLHTNKLARVYTFPKFTYKRASYFNDLRVDDRRGKIYITDSGAAGLIVLDAESGEAERLFDDSPYTRAEQDYLVIGGQRWGKGPVHADGIALDGRRGILYLHALTGHTLYALKTDALISKDPLLFSLRTAAPDGMIVGPDGNLYFGDLENQKIQYLNPDTREIKTLVDKGPVAWPDTFSVYQGMLYYTNSRIHESGGDIGKLEYTLYRVALPAPAQKR